MALRASLPGYARIGGDGVRGLAIESSRIGLEEILAAETLYEYARRQPSGREFKGRVPAYAITLPQGGDDVVVRHAMRGGALGKTGSDLFLPPTRALRELINSIRLRMAGVPTPEVVAFVTYRAGPLLRRSDVATREIKGGHDLSVVLSEMPDDDHRAQCLTAAGKLLAHLARVGAHHPDLNARNILITWDDGQGARAHVLDVDRIRFHVPADPMVSRANFTRLERSLKKLREREGILVSDHEVEAIRAASDAPSK